MASVLSHYETHLAPVYLWMAGGIETALAQGAQELDGFGAGTVAGGGAALDLGAGFGKHAIPLARAGWNVCAVDSSAHLLAELRQFAAGLATIRTAQADICAFDTAVDGPYDLVICLGDTLTHLQTHTEVDDVCRKVAGQLAPGGRVVFGFRDYSQPLAGDARFIPVRSDADRILTCFLEALPDHMQVHDLLHERQAAVWVTRVSSYPKLRLAPARVVQALEQLQLRARVEPGPAGMVRVVATRG